MTSKEEIIQVIKDTYLNVLKRQADLDDIEHYLDRWEDPKDELNSVQELTVILKNSNEYIKNSSFDLSNVTEEITNIKKTVSQNNEILHNLIKFLNNSK